MKLQHKRTDLQSEFVGYAGFYVKGLFLYVLIPWGWGGRMFQRRAERNRAMNGSVREVVASVASTRCQPRNAPVRR
ncbi:MAG: hypothetical protein FWE90_06745 [Defluviitaleaceae bacterium]|nr:hypothetical protein [Defluviitaleaceae bacterium]